MKKVLQWQTRLKIKKYSTIIMVVTFLLSITFVGLTIYGTKAGNFVINIAEVNDVKLALSETSTFDTPVSYLFAEGMTSMNLMTYNEFPQDIMQLDSIDGSHNDDTGYKKYIAYTFYLKNYSTTSVDIDATINIMETTQNVDSAMRLMLIVNSQDVKIYGKAQEGGANDGKAETCGNHTAIPFESDTEVMHQSFVNVAKDQVIKFTVVIWLEGWDAQAVDSIKGGILKTMMNFKGY